MTRHDRKLTSVAGTDKSALLEPLAPSRHLTSVVVERIAGEIDSGALKPGERLPTEQEMMLAFGVSRTVIREAVAALRADGRVITRQGSGAFVAADSSQRPFRLDAATQTSLAHVLHVLELRRAVEVEAAELAAVRGTPLAHKRIAQAHARFVKAIQRGESAIPEDFAFHRAIAEATANPQFSKFLGFLGGFIIPRQSVRIGGLDEARHATYLARLVDEHHAICEAIAARSPMEARKAMRLHLTRSSERYRRLYQSADGPATARGDKR